MIKQGLCVAIPSIPMSSAAERTSVKVGSSKLECSAVKLDFCSVTLRAIQIAMSEPRGPVYLFGAREIMEEILPSQVQVNMDHWQPMGSSALPPSAVKQISELLIHAKSPLVITSWLGNNPRASLALVRVCEKLSIPVVDG